MSEPKNPNWRRDNMAKARAKKLEQQRAQKQPTVVEAETEAEAEVEEDVAVHHSSGRTREDPLVCLIRHEAREICIELLKQSNNSGWLSVAAGGLGLMSSFAPGLLQSWKTRGGVSAEQKKILGVSSSTAGATGLLELYS